MKAPRRGPGRPKGALYTDEVKYKEDPEVVAAVRAVVKRERTTLSDWYRRAARRALGKSDV